MARDKRDWYPTTRDGEKNLYENIATVMKLNIRI